ncbi:MAG: flagellar biosynthesis protein [Paracoccaceae bacterium]
MPPLKLENFNAEGGETLPPLAEDRLEEARLAAYEAGYSAGWEDATAAQAGDQARMGADLARHLQSLGFTYQEARIHILRAVEPVLQQVVTRLLPEIAREAIAPVVSEALMPLVAGLADTPVELLLNPAARPAVEPRLQATTGLPITVVEEPTLGEGQVYLRLGTGAEARVDLDRAVARIATAVRGFFELSRAPQAAGAPMAERAHG